MAKEDSIYAIPCIVDGMAKRDHILSDEHSCCWRESINDPDFYQNLASPDLKNSKFISCPHVKCMRKMVLLD